MNSRHFFHRFLHGWSMNCCHCVSSSNWTRMPRKSYTNKQKLAILNEVEKGIAEGQTLRSLARSFNNHVHFEHFSTYCVFLTWSSTTPFFYTDDVNLDARLLTIHSVFGSAVWLVNWSMYCSSLELASSKCALFYCPAQCAEGPIKCTWILPKGSRTPRGLKPREIR